MHQSSQNSKDNQNSLQEEMIDEQYEESNHFTERQIQIIRSYIGDLSLQKSSNNQTLKEIVKKIQQETQLDSKSAKQIQLMINKILSGQSSSSSQKLQNKQPALKVKQQINAEKRGSFYTQSFLISSKISQNEPKNSIFKSQYQQALFQPKSLFKTFNQNLSGNMEQNQLQISSAVKTQKEGNFTGLKKINLFTKPSVQLIKNSSSGFVSLGEKNFGNSNIITEKIQCQNNGQLPSFSKKATKQFKESNQAYQCKSKRKIKPTYPLLVDPSLTGQQKIEWIQSNTNDCHSILQKKLLKKSSNLGKQSFYIHERFSSIYNQYFYCNYDKIYFNQQNGFSKLIQLFGLESKKISLKKVKTVKRVLPKPRLLNIDFVISQQNKLNEFRSQLRQIPKQQQRSRNQQIQLVVGREVTALHPVCGHLHSGTILAIYKENQYMVKFSRPQLGILTI